MSDSDYKTAFFENGAHAWSVDAAETSDFDAFEQEFALSSALIAARSRAGLSQAELAARMGTTPSAIAQLEGGQKPSTYTLERFAEATGHRLDIQFTPLGGRSALDED